MWSVMLWNITAVDREWLSCSHEYIQKHRDEGSYFFSRALLYEEVEDDENESPETIAAKVQRGIVSKVLPDVEMFQPDEVAFRIYGNMPKDYAEAFDKAFRELGWQPF
jgi:hypothetical protein